MIEAIPTSTEQQEAINYWKEIISAQEEHLKEIEKRIVTLKNDGQVDGVDYVDRYELSKLKLDSINLRNSLKSRKKAYDILLQRASEWEQKFNEQSKVVNENFENVIKLTSDNYSRSKNLQTAFFMYRSKKELYENNQSEKNKMYFSLFFELKKLKVIK